MVETVLRLAGFVVAIVLLRTATVARNNWQEKFSSSFELEWSGWVGWIALVVAAGAMVGLAVLAGRPGRYRLVVPLAISLPALLLLAHYFVVFEWGIRGEDLPWILDHIMFYMDTPAQFALAMAAGFGIAAGLQPRGTVGRRDGSPVAAGPPAEDSPRASTAPQRHRSPDEASPRL